MASSVRTERFLRWTSRDMDRVRRDWIRALRLDGDTEAHFVRKVARYQPIEDVRDLRKGAYLLWIPLEDPEWLPMHHGGLLCSLRATPRGVELVCKAFPNRHYTWLFDACLVFQKLSPREELVLTALDWVSPAASGSPVFSESDTDSTSASNDSASNDSSSR
jgi:hypothetical protein